MISNPSPGLYCQSPENQNDFLYYRRLTIIKMYRVFLESAAERDLRRLTARLHNRIISAIQALTDEPRPRG